VPQPRGGCHRDPVVTLGTPGAPIRYTRSLMIAMMAMAGLAAVGHWVLHLF